MSKLTKILMVVLIVLSAFKSAEPQKVWLDQAISENLISAKFVYNTNSVHYEKPLIAEITNKTSKPLEVRIPAGMVFTADNDEEQNIVVTRNTIVRMKPNESKGKAFAGNCMEHDDSAGDEGSTYTLKGAADSELKTLVKYLNKNKVNPSLGQKAVWCLTDNEGLESIYDQNSGKADVLRKYVSDLTGKELPKPESMQGYEFNHDAEPLIAVQGAMNLMLSHDCKLEIAMFDMEGRMVRELFRYDKILKGKHRLTYQFDNSVYTNKHYEIKVIRDSEVIFTRDVDLS